MIEEHFTDEGMLLPSVDRPFAKVDELISRVIHSQLIGGAVVMVSWRGQVVHRVAMGYLDRENGVPMHADVIFRGASLTKPLTSVTTLLLHEQGLLSIHDPVTHYLPAFRPRLSDGYAPEITLDHLLTHTAGLNYTQAEPGGGPYHHLGVSTGLDQPGLSLAENLERLAQAPLLFHPGTAWNYSMATDVLGGVLEQVTGESLGELFQRVICDVLDMPDTDFSVKDEGRFAIPYADAPQQGMPLVLMTGDTQVPFFEGALQFSPTRVFHPDSYPSGGAGINTTALDFLRFLEGLRTGRLFTSSSSEDLLCQDAIPHLDGPAPGKGFGRAFSIIRNPMLLGLPLSSGSWQWGGVWGHNWFVDPARELTVVAMTNTAVAGCVGDFPDAMTTAIVTAVDALRSD